MFVSSLFFFNRENVDQAQAQAQTYVEKRIPGVQFLARVQIKEYLRLSFETPEKLSGEERHDIEENTEHDIFIWNEPLVLDPDPSKQDYVIPRQLVYYLDNIAPKGHCLVQEGLYTINCDLKPRYHIRFGGVTYAFDAPETFEHWVKYVLRTEQRND